MNLATVLARFTLMLGVTACTSLPSGTPDIGTDYPSAWPAIVSAGPDCGGLRGNYHDAPISSIGPRYRFTQLVRDAERSYGAVGEELTVTAVVTLYPMVSDAKLVVHVDTPVRQSTRTFKTTEHTGMTVKGSIQRHAKSIACVDGVLELQYEYSDITLPLPFIRVRHDTVRLYKVSDGLVIGLTQVSFFIPSKQELTWLRYASAAAND